MELFHPTCRGEITPLITGRCPPFFGWDIAIMLSSSPKTLPSARPGKIQVGFKMKISSVLGGLPWGSFIEDQAEQIEWTSLRRHV